MVYSDQSASPPAPAPAEGTRERVLQLVLTRGPVSAAEIGRELELTAAAVRRHLDALEEDSLVEVKRVTAARGAGRPSRRYVVTSHAQEHLPKDHLAVALDTLARLEELGGEEEVRRTARHAFREIEERFTAAVDGRETALQHPDPRAGPRRGRLRRHAAPLRRGPGAHPPRGPGLPGALPVPGNSRAPSGVL